MPPSYAIPTPVYPTCGSHSHDKVNRRTRKHCASTSVSGPPFSPDTLRRRANVGNPLPPAPPSHSSLQCTTLTEHRTFQASTPAIALGTQRSPVDVAAQHREGLYPRSRGTAWHLRHRQPDRPLHATQLSHPTRPSTAAFHCRSASSIL